MDTLGTVRFKASGTLTAFDGSKSWGVSVWVVDGTLSRSITPGSRAGSDGGAGAGLCSVVRAGAARAGRVVRRVPAGVGVVPITRTSGNVIDSCARAPPASTAKLAEPHSKKSELRTIPIRSPYARRILARSPNHPWVVTPIPVFSGLSRGPSRCIFPKPTGKFWQRLPRSGSGRRCRQQLYRQPDQVRQVAGVELLLELRRHVDHRLVADAELVGDLPIGLALGQQRQGLQLPRGQIGEPVTAQPGAHHRDLHRHVAAQVRGSGAHLLERLDQLVGRGVLEHIAVGTGLERARGDHRIAVHAENKDTRTRVM